MGRRGQFKLGALVLAAGLASAGGCASNPVVDRTDGLTLEIHVRTPENAHALYRVERDGTLGFGGGLRAMSNGTSWTGPLTDDEIARLQEAVRASGWLDAAPDELIDGATRYRVRLRVRRADGADLSRIFHTTDGRTRLVLDVLEPAAMRRHDAVLRALPQPADPIGALPPEEPP